MEKYILYGAAAIGDLVKDSLEKNGLEVIGYIDKRASELSEYNGLMVWSIEEVPQEYIDAEVNVYISVKNVFEHEKIALLLRKRGFTKIIYKPYSVLMGHGNEAENRIAKIYDCLFAGEKLEHFVIPQAEKGKECYNFAEISESGDKVTVYIPTEFIFTNDYGNTAMAKWGNICILAFFTHIDFFRFLNNQSDIGPEDYLQEYCVFTANIKKKIKITNAWKNNVIENRSQIYEQMKEALDLDPDFFVRNAAEAVWNKDKKYFNLVSGKHRCTFQAAVGKKYIPLKIAKKDFDIFLNKSEVNETIRLLDREAVIPHPYFYRGMYIKDGGEYYVQEWFARYYGRKTYFRYGKIDFERLKVLDYTKDMGNFSRFARRLGCQVQRRPGPDLLERQINRLSFSEGICYSGEIVSKENNIIMIEADQLELSEVKMLAAKRNEWIIKYGTFRQISRFARQYNMSMVSVINTKFYEGEILYSYLLERENE